jgi:membrane-anchored protein YejM (alkaline phosphatase superfamily)
MSEKSDEIWFSFLAIIGTVMLILFSVELLTVVTHSFLTGNIPDIINIIMIATSTWVSFLLLVNILNILKR